MSNRGIGHALDLSDKSVRLEAIDAEDQIISRGSGFVVKESTGMYLYTCWHIVTGLNFLSLKVNVPPKAKKIRIYKKRVQNAEVGFLIGGTEMLSIDLYKGNQPVWLQQQQDTPHADLNNINIRVPKEYDLVALKLPDSKIGFDPVHFSPLDIFDRYMSATQDVIISGYPYGYSSLLQQPEPIMIKRSVASNFHEKTGIHLLDGTGFPGMSGSPIYYKSQNKFRLWGVYTGSIYPDHDFLDNAHDKNDKFAALGLSLNFAWARKGIFG